MYFSLGRYLLELAQETSCVALASHIARSSTPFGVTERFLFERRALHLLSAARKPCWGFCPCRSQNQGGGLQGNSFMFCIFVWMAYPDQADSLQGSLGVSCDNLAANDPDIGSGWQSGKQNWALPAVVGK